MNVYASVALSGDGYMDDRSPRRLILSTPADWREVMRLRAWADAILVGAETVRRDDPSLTVRDEALRRERLAANRLADPAKGLSSKIRNSAVIKAVGGSLSRRNRGAAVRKLSITQARTTEGDPPVSTA